MGRDEARVSFNLPITQTTYKNWLQVNTYNKTQENYYKYLLSNYVLHPVISVIMPVYNTEVHLLQKSLDSIRNQVYTNWELVIIDDGSTSKELLTFLTTITDNNIIIKHTANQGISKATNYGVVLSKGKFIAFVDHDDVLHPSALAEVILAYNATPDAQVFYSDSDKIDIADNRYDPRFKPDFSPELLLSHMYMNHLLVVLKVLFVGVQGFQAEFDTAQDYQFILKCLVYDAQLKVVHIPKVLYHWRASNASLALSADSKPESILRGQQALQWFLDIKCQREHLPRVICEQYGWAKLSRCGYYKLNFLHSGPEVTIIIPIKDKLDLLKQCLGSIQKNTLYQNYKILIVDNGSIEKDTITYLNNNKDIFTSITVPTVSFNFAEINNVAVKHVTSDYVLFLNNDTKILNKDWLSNLMGFIQFKAIGAVGSCLLFPDGTIQHAGLVNGLITQQGTIVAPILRGSASLGATYDASARVSRNTTGVTAACLLMQTELFSTIGGFDENKFKVGYNDPDLCWKIIQTGKRIVYCPNTQILHYEGKTRETSKKIDDLQDSVNYKIKYKGYTDPFYNKNFSLSNSDYSIDSRLVLTSQVCPKFVVAAITYNLNLEGSSFSQYELICGLVKKSNIEFIIYSTQDGELRKKYESQGIRVKIVDSPFGNNYNYYSYQEGLKVFKKDFKEENIDLVYCNTLQTFYGIHAAKELLLPSLWNIRESEPINSYFGHFGQQIAFIALECFFYSYKNIFVSFSSLKGCEQFNCKNNFHIIPNGLNIERFRTVAREKNVDSEDSTTIFVNVGTVCERKNQIETLRALALMTPEELKNIHVVIVGIRQSLPYYTTFIQYFNTLPISTQSHVTLVEETNDVEDYYMQGDVFVFNTLVESYPRVILEALHYDLPIISTPVNGITEQINALTADFYNPGDVNALKDLMIMYTDKEYRESKRKNCAKQLESLTSYDDMIIQYKSLFIEAYLSGWSR